VNFLVDLAEKLWSGVGNTDEKMYGETAGAKNFFFSVHSCMLANILLWFSVSIALIMDEQVKLI
jgi:hypothetical protein